MFLSEAEAKTKWCPFSRVHDGENRHGNEAHTTPTGTNCIGGRCMMFRYEQLTGSFYCGLAGKDGLF